MVATHSITFNSYIDNMDKLRKPLNSTLIKIWGS